MKIKLFFRAIILLAVSVLALASPTRAMAPGTQAAKAALSFDPFNPTVTSSTPVSSMTVADSASLVVPSSIVTPSTPINPGDIGVSINDVEVQLNASHSVVATLTVKLSKAGTSKVTVTYDTHPWTAKANQDYIPTSGTLTFNPGVTSQTIHVTVPKGTGKTDLYFFVDLLKTNGEKIVKGRGVVEIDGIHAPEILVTGSVVARPKSGTGIIYATVAMDQPPTSGTSVTLKTVDGTAKAGVDYIATSVVVTFKPGQASKKVPITVKGISSAVPTRAFLVVLSHPVNGYIEPIVPSSPSDTPIGDAIMTITGHK